MQGMKMQLVQSDRQWVNNFHIGDILPMIFNDATWIQ